MSKLHIFVVCDGTFGLPESNCIPTAGTTGSTIQYSTCIAPFSLGKPSDSEALATSGQSSVKAASNKKVFNLDLKVLKSLVHLMSAGREFQTAGAA